MSANNPAVGDRVHLSWLVNDSEIWCLLARITEVFIKDGVTHVKLDVTYPESLSGAAPGIDESIAGGVAYHEYLADTDIRIASGTFHYVTHYCRTNVRR